MSLRYNFLFIWNIKSIAAYTEINEYLIRRMLGIRVGFRPDCMMYETCFHFDCRL